MAHHFKKLFCLLGMGFLVQTAMAEECDMLVSACNFETQQPHTLNDLVTTGYATPKVHVNTNLYAPREKTNDSLPYYTFTSNPKLIDSTFIDVEKNMMVFHLPKSGKIEVSKLLSYEVAQLTPGSDYEVSFTAYLLNGPDNEITKELDSTSLNNSDILAVVKLNDEDITQVEETLLSFKNTNKLPITIKGSTLDKRESTLNLEIRTGYRMAKGLSIGISDIKIKGCYSPRVVSNKGKITCIGEIAYFTLDKEYETSSYKWMLKAPGENSYSEIGNGKDVYFELDKDGEYTIYCETDELTSSPLIVNTIPCCEDGDGNKTSRQLVFNEDFGYFDDWHTYTDAQGNTTTTPATWAPERADVNWNLSEMSTMRYDYKGKINDTYYGVIVPSRMGYYIDTTGELRAVWAADVSSDHSSLETDKKGGAALFMNISEGFSGVIFSKEINNLPVDHIIYFEAYIANMTGGYNPEVTINIKDAATGKLLASGKSEALANASWRNVRTHALMESTSVIFEVVSSGTGELSYWEKGNDLIIDDIRAWACVTPSVDLCANVETTGNIVLKTLVSNMLDKWNKGNEQFLFQLSADGENWENITATTSNNEYVFETKNLANDTNYYRVVVAPESVLAPFIENPNEPSYNDLARNYSISKAIMVVNEKSATQPSVDNEADAPYYYVEGGKLVVNAAEGSRVDLYTTLGLKIASVKNADNSQTFDTKGQKIVVLVVDGKAYKVIVK